MNLEATGSLNEASPTNTPEFTQWIVSENYGIDCMASQLACERDQVFQLQVENGERLILRYSNPAEDREVTDFQVKVLLYLEEAASELPLSRIIRNRVGDANSVISMSDGRESVVTVSSFLPGITLAKVSARGPSIRHEMAQILAYLDRALSGFSHPAANHELLWDMKHAASLRDKLHCIQDQELRELASWGLHNFESRVLPVQDSLRWQVIHNDLNFSNVMIHENRNEVSGVIDFGDMVYTPLINDVAVAAAYQLGGDKSDTFEVLMNFVCSYHEVMPLERKELELVYDLVVTRMVLSLAIGEWRANLYPENRRYILRNHPVVIAAIRSMARLNRQQVSEELVARCLH